MSISHTEPTTWRRVTKSDPCPICGKGDWCGVSCDGSVAICMRSESDRPTPNGGHLHRLVNQDHREPVRRRPKIVPLQHPDFGATASEFRAALSQGQIDTLSSKLGVSAWSLRQFGVGWDGSRNFTFPMHDASRRVIGIRLRCARSGGKFAVKGSKEGVFLPYCDAEGPMLVTEGPTDAAAALDLGYFAIGRPSCTGSTGIVAKLTRGCDVVIVADADAPGQRGAEALASAILPTARQLRVVTPPTGVKDLRQWLCQGATSEDLQRRIESVPARRLQVRCNHV